MKLRSILGTTLALGAMSVAVLPAVAGARAVKRSATAVASPVAGSDRVSFAGLIIANPATGTFQVVATSCTLTSADDSGSFLCSISGTGSGSAGTIRITSADGTIVTTVALCGCGQITGSGQERDFDNGVTSPITTFGYFTSRTRTAAPNVDNVTGFLVVSPAGQVGG